MELGTKHRTRSSTLRTALAMSPIVVAFGVCITVYVYTKPYRALRDWQDQTLQSLDFAKGNPPASLSTQQWEFIVDWTKQAVPNCFSSPAHIRDLQAFNNFQVELKHRYTNRLLFLTSIGYGIISNSLL